MKYIITLLAIVLTSCSTWDLYSNPNDGEPRGPLTGRVYRRLDNGDAKTVIDMHTVNWWAKVAFFFLGDKYDLPKQEQIINNDK